MTSPRRGLTRADLTRPGFEAFHVAFARLAPRLEKKLLDRHLGQRRIAGTEYAHVLVEPVADLDFESAARCPRYALIDERNDGAGSQQLVVGALDDRGLDPTQVVGAGLLDLDHLINRNLECGDDWKVVVHGADLPYLVASGRQLEGDDVLGVPCSGGIGFVRPERERLSVAGRGLNERHQNGWSVARLVRVRKARRHEHERLARDVHVGIVLLERRVLDGSATRCERAEGRNQQQQPETARYLQAHVFLPVSWNKPLHRAVAF